MGMYYRLITWAFTMIISLLFTYTSHAQTFADLQFIDFGLTEEQWLNGSSALIKSRYDAHYLNGDDRFIGFICMVVTVVTPSNKENWQPRSYDIACYVSVALKNERLAKKTNQPLSQVSVDVLKHMKFLASTGDARALFEVGRMIDTGMYGVSRGQSREWYEKAAKAGSSAANRIINPPARTATRRLSPKTNSASNSNRRPVQSRSATKSQNITLSSREDIRRCIKRKGQNMSPRRTHGQSWDKTGNGAWDREAIYTNQCGFPITMRLDGNSRTVGYYDKSKYPKHFDATIKPGESILHLCSDHYRIGAGVFGEDIWERTNCVVKPF